MYYISEADNEVIIYLFNNEEKNFTEIKNAVSVGQYALNTSLTKIKALSITIERRGDRNARIISLTNRGRQIAKKLVEIQVILNDENKIL